MLKPAELAAFRESLKLDEQEFGAWVSGKLGQEHPWPASAVEAWETGKGTIPYIIQAAVYRGLWERDRSGPSIH